jgi:hypothetical protein
MLLLGEPDPAVGLLMRALSPAVSGWPLFPELRDVLEPHVLARADNGDPEVRVLVALAIETMHATDDAAEAALCELLQDQSPEVVEVALSTVSRLGLRTRRLARTIGEMIRRRSGFSVSILSHGYRPLPIGPAAVPELIHFAEAGGSIGDDACVALGRIGAPAVQAIPTLERVLDSPGAPYEHTVSCAAVALRRIREAVARES